MSVLDMLGKVGKPGGGGRRAMLIATLPKWLLYGSHLAVYAPTAVVKGKPVAAFDLDDTIVTTKGSSRFATSASDWRFVSERVVSKVHGLWREGYVVVVFTNQGAVVAGTAQASFQRFTGRTQQVMAALMEGAPEGAVLRVYAALKYPKSKTFKGVKSSESEHLGVRKPQRGMWDVMEGELEVSGGFYVGDAAGRQGDFSDSDRKFAEAVGVEFRLPEDMWGEELAQALAQALGETLAQTLAQALGEALAQALGKETAG